MEFAVFGLAFAGVCCLCLATKRHHAQSFRVAPSGARRLGLRLAGAGLIAAALLCAGAGQGWAIGPVEWVGALGLGGVALNVMHGFRPGWTPYAGPLAALVAFATVVAERFPVL